MSRFESYARLGGDDRFRWIAERSLTRFFELDPSVKKLRKRLSDVLSAAENPDEPPDEYHEAWIELDPIEEERDQECIVATVFTGLYFEALIYDYGASCLGDKYVRNYLDKLDFMSKWIIVPRLTVGKEIDKAGKAYAALHQLHKDRNSLVHLKSRELSFTPEQMTEYLAEREKDLQRSAQNCKTALESVVQELYELDPEHPKLRLLRESAKHNTSLQPTSGRDAPFGG